MTSTAPSHSRVCFDEPSERFHTLNQVLSTTEIAATALEVNGFTPGELRDTNKQTLAQVLTQAYWWCEKNDVKLFAGQNVNFDHRFMLDGFDKCDLFWMSKRFGHRMLDLHSTAFARLVQLGLQPPEKMDLDTALMIAGLPRRDTKRENKHSALDDAILETEAFYRYIFGQSRLSEYSQYPVPKRLIVKER